MQVTVKTSFGKQIIVEVETNDTIEKLKQKIEEKEGIPTDEQRLIYVGKVLQNDKTLADFNIVNNCTIHILIGRGRCAS